MKIERLSGSEWHRLKRIRLAAFAEAPDAFGTTLETAQSWKDDVWRQQAEDLATFIATTGMVDVGVVRGSIDESSSDAHLISMWVRPAERGKRVGEQLVEALVKWAREEGFSRVLLDVADNNPTAIALYERLGFRSTGETSVYPPPRAHITEHRRALTL